jgi:hypothetical protein
MSEHNITCIPYIYAQLNILSSKDLPTNNLLFLVLQEIHVRDFGGKLVITAFVLNALVG